jgi:hypothetical protein
MPFYDIIGKIYLLHLSLPLLPRDNTIAVFYRIFVNVYLLHPLHLSAGVNTAFFFYSNSRNKGTPSPSISFSKKNQYL